MRFRYIPSRISRAYSNYRQKRRTRKKTYSGSKKKKNTMMTIIIVAILAILGYFFRDKIKALFAKKP